MILRKCCQAGVGHGDHAVLPLEFFTASVGFFIEAPISFPNFCFTIFCVDGM